MKKKKAALEADRKAKEKEAAEKAPAGKGKKDAKKAGKKKWLVDVSISALFCVSESINFGKDLWRY